jgi:flagellar hook-associated protein 3 FlgL
MNQLVALRDALQSGNASAVQATQAGLESGEDHLLKTISNIGATQSRLEADAAQNQARFAELEKLTAAETDVDLAQTVTRLSQAQSAYQAALESGVRIMSLSLLDYLR